MVEGSSAEQLAFQPSLYLLALTTAVQQFGSNASFSLSLHTLSCLPPSANISLSLFLACSELVCSPPPPPPPPRRPWLQSPTGSALRRLVSDSLLWGTDVCFSCCCKLRWRWWSHTFTHYHWVHSISPAVLFTATPSTSCSISSVCSINWRQRPQHNRLRRRLYLHQSGTNQFDNRSTLFNWLFSFSFCFFPQNCLPDSSKLSAHRTTFALWNRILHFWLTDNF